MTVIVETNSIQYITAGTAGETFPTVFKFFDNTDVGVLLGGVLQVELTNYSIAGGGGAVGTVTWIGTPAAGLTLDVIRRVPAVQTHNYLENDSFPSETHEATVDKIAMATAARMGLSATDPRQWDAGAGAQAGTRRILNLAAPTDAADAVTKAYADGLSIGSITIPTPVDPADDDKVLESQSGLYVLNFPPFPNSLLPGAGDVDNVLTATGAGVMAWVALGAPLAVGDAYNWLINGDMQVVQRNAISSSFTATSVFPNDDASYLVDKWALLSDGDDVVDVRLLNTTPPTGTPWYMRSLVATINKKWGYIQILEARMTQQILRDGTSSKVSLQFKLRTNTGNVIENVRAAVIGWTGTADLPTLDCISAWNASGSNPTLIADWNSGGPGADGYYNTPVNISVTVDAWATHTIENIAVDEAGIENLAVLIWVDDDDASLGDELFITDVQLEIGEVANRFASRPIGVEMLLCQRYCWSSLSRDTQPILTGTNHTLEPMLFGTADTDGEVYITRNLPVEMWREFGGARTTVMPAETGGNAGAITDFTVGAGLTPTILNSTTQICLRASGAGGNANHHIGCNVIISNDLGE